jgi:hypothetical protein
MKVPLRSSLMACSSRPKSIDDYSRVRRTTRESMHAIGAHQKNPPDISRGQLNIKQKIPIRTNN